MEGGLWVFEADDGKTYQLRGGPRDSYRDGQRVEIVGEVDRDAVGIGMVGETLAAIPQRRGGADEVVRLWLDSGAHRAILLEPGFRRIGVARRWGTLGSAENAVVTRHWAEGGMGSADLAEAVVAACEKPSDFKFLYPLEWSIKQKIEHIAKVFYSAADVTYEPLAEEQIANYERAGFGKLPICMAKTHLSISHDPLVKGAPSGFTMPVREVRASVGAGFIYPLIGSMSTMPGLATYPAYMKIDLDPETGEIKGLS